MVVDEVSTGTGRGTITAGVLLVVTAAGVEVGCTTAGELSGIVELSSLFKIVLCFTSSKACEIAGVCELKKSRLLQGAPSPCNI